MKNLIYILLPVLLIGCIEEETPIEPYDRGDVQIQTVEMGTDYSIQGYFDLGTNSLISSNKYAIWDLGFECAPGGFNIILNTAKFAKANDIGPAFLDEEIEFDDSKIRYDSPKGFVDSTAIGKWWITENDSIISKNHVYLIDLGTDENVIKQGIKKLKIDSFSNDSYYISYCDLDGSNLQSLEIKKNESYNFLYVNLKTNEILELEPPKLQWDLLFTKHTEMLEYEDSELGYLPYSVTSVLINQHYVETASFVSDVPFDEIDISVIDTLNFTNYRNVIGHTWKYYDFEDGYLVFPENVYIIKDTQGFYYKLHFVDFYNDLGEKGYPKFEFQKI